MIEGAGARLYVDAIEERFHRRGAPEHLAGVRERRHRLQLSCLFAQSDSHLAATAFKRCQSLYLDSI